jgi:hypothetical protein
MNGRVRSILCSLVSCLAWAGCGASTTPPPEEPTELSASECSDGRDNDADGSTDCDDLACTVHAFCEPPPARVENTAALCANGADDDADGATDCADPDCAAQPSCGAPPPVENTAALCANDADDDADGATDCDDADCAPFCMTSGETRTYVISVLTLPEPSGSGVTAAAAGFDLDGVRSTGAGTTCVELTPDYASLNDPGELGIDNAMASLVPTIESLSEESIDEMYERAILEGRLLLLVQVRGIDDYASDESIEVQLYAGQVPGGGAPIAAGGSLAPDQTFTGTPIGGAVMGVITSGRLRARLPLLSLESDALLLGSNLRDVELRANITPSTLSSGAIGGSLLVAEIAADAEATMAGLGATALTVLHGVSDLQPQAADPSTCDSLSTGLLFSAVSAELADL